MPDKTFKKSGGTNRRGSQEKPAGCFSSWLRRTRAALILDRGAVVPCGDCSDCCRSSYFIHIRPEEFRTISRIDKKLLFPAPGLPKGHLLLGHFGDGCCPLLIGEKCSIYQDRSLTCRIYDCRIFAAAGIDAGGKAQERITRRVREWQFSYPTRTDRMQHDAVRAAAVFLQEQQSSFPAGSVPENPSQLAILAIKVYRVFLPGGEAGNREGEMTNLATAKAVMAANEKFEQRCDQHKKKPAGRLPDHNR